MQADIRSGAEISKGKKIATTNVLVIFLRPLLIDLLRITSSGNCHPLFSTACS